MARRGLPVRLLRILPPWMAAVLCVLYFILPVDLIPDFFGLPGRVDDVLVGLLTLLYMHAASRRRMSRDPRDAGGRTAGPGDSRREGRGKADGGTPRTERAAPADPYAVLGVSRETPTVEIRTRYKDLLLQYHPDRVQHLGEELRETAERKTQEINVAYQRILKARKERP